MKKLTTALLLTLLAVSPTLGDDADTLRIGVNPDYPPFSGIDESGRLSGFDIDIARAMCEHLHVDCTLVAQEWEGMIPELRAGTFDAIVASMSITDERRRLVAFTDRYYRTAVRFVARKDSDFDPATPAGRTIGAWADSIASAWLQENVSDVAALRMFSGQDEFLRALTMGDVDALFGDALGFWMWLQTPEGADFAFFGDGHHLDEGIGIAVRKEDDALRLRLNQAIESIVSDGTYQKINARYFPFSIY